MAFTERLRLIIDVVAPGGGGLGNLKKDIGEAEGAFAKMRVGAAGAFDYVKQNAGLAMVSAGSALVGFGIKAVGAFQEAALGAGRLSSALGVTTEEASRLQEVAGDVGVGTDTFARAIGRMNRELGSSPEKFAAVGAAIARSQDGTVNVTETFLNVVEALNKIPDPARRAVAAQELLGRGWQDLSRVIALGADELRTQLASVESSKVFTDADIARAEEFRDTMDSLKGVWESTAIEAGGAIVAVTNFIADAKQGVDDYEDSIERALGANISTSDITIGFDVQAKKAELAAAALERSTEAGLAWAEAAIAGGTAAAEAAEATSGLDAALGAIEGSYAGAAKAAEELAKAEQAGADALMEAVDARRAAADSQFALNDARRDFTDLLGEEKGLLEDEATTMADLAKWQDEVATSAGSVADAQLRLAQETATANGEILSAADAGRIWSASMLESAAAVDGPARDAILAYIATVEGIPPEKMTEITAAVNAGDLATAQALLDEASRVREAQILATALTKVADGDLAGLTEEERIAFIDAWGGDLSQAEQALGDLTDAEREALIDAIMGSDSASKPLNDIRARQRDAAISAVPGSDRASTWINRIAAGPYSAKINVTAVATNTVMGAAAGAVKRSAPPSSGPVAAAQTVTATGVAVPLVATPSGTLGTIYVNVPAPKPTNVTINAGVVGNRYDVERVVAKSLRAHQRLNGGPR